MIHYQVLCSREHEFDGWFKDSAGFDKQIKRRLIECPTCGDTQVRRALMAPAVSKRMAPPSPAQTAAPPPRTETSEVATPPVPVAGGRMPAHLRAMLQQMRSEVERSCDYVGPLFADEARKIHRGESDKRGIYGETTPDQAAALEDEGIEIASIPWEPLSDS